MKLRRPADMTVLGGMYRDQPVFSALAMIPIFSLAGVPRCQASSANSPSSRARSMPAPTGSAGWCWQSDLLTLLSMGTDVG